MENAARDGNFVPTLLGVSSADGTTPIRLWVNPANHRLIVDAVGGTIIGPGSSTDNAIVLWDGTDGTTIQNSSVTISSSEIVLGALTTHYVNGRIKEQFDSTGRLDILANNDTVSVGFPVVTGQVGGYSDMVINANVQIGTNFSSSAPSNLDVAGNIVAAGNIGGVNGAFSGNVTTTGNTDSATYSAGGTQAVADGTYTVGIGVMTNGTITVKGGIITAVQEAS